MYNLNVNLATGPGNHNLLSLDLGCTTPKTPEILNSLIAMSNPFDGYNHHARKGGPRIASCPPGNSDSSSAGSSMGSPGTPPSVQHTCSQLIKEGLKLTIQTKRRHKGQDVPGENDDFQRPSKMARRSGGGGGGGGGGDASPHNTLDGDFDDDYEDMFSPGIGLTAEDEERRRRRRERNKVAATKCRLKKREKTVNLVQESEILENQNHDLKGQIQDLETQRRNLVEMLSMHRPTCTKPPPVPPATHPHPHHQPHPHQLQHQQQQHQQQQQQQHQQQQQQQQQHNLAHVQYVAPPPQELDAHAPGSSYCSDTPVSSYCAATATMDTPTTAYSQYDNCSYGGGYAPPGDSGCMV